MVVVRPLGDFLELATLVAITVVVFLHAIGRVRVRALLAGLSTKLHVACTLRLLTFTTVNNSM
jgi:hypothetical protein